MSRALGPQPWLIDLDVDDPNEVEHAVIDWADAGDLRPLAWAIRNGHDITAGLAEHLAEMIEEGRLVVKAKGRGRPRNPEAKARDYLAVKAFSHRGDIKYDKAIQIIADWLCVSPETVRLAINKSRKPGMSLEEFFRSRGLI
jgi:hypothetical protein